MTELGNRRSEALSVLLFEQQTWQLRKVESYQLKGGNYSVVRVSIDCVPQDLDGLRYTLGDGKSADAAFIVPVTYMEKGVLRQFDMKGPNGDPLPVVGRSEAADLMLGVLMYQIDDALNEGVDRATVKKVLQTILDGDKVQATEASKQLVETEAADGPPLLRPEQLRGFARELLTSLATSYVLMVLLPRECAQRRVVIKYSHQARPSHGDMRWTRRWLGAAGLSRLPVSFGLSHPAGSGSHHLEVWVPPALSCPSLRMPGPAHGRNTEDASEGGVVHVAYSYTEDPGDPAVAEFEVPWTGMRATACLVSATTFVILYLGIVMPGAQQALLEAADGAGALLLAVPAVAVAFAAGRRESAVEAALLGPLRYGVLTCALWLLAAAASLVGALHEPWRTAFWSTGAVVFGGLSAALCAREAKKRFGRAWTPLVTASAVLLVVLLACGIWLW